MLHRRSKVLPNIGAEQLRAEFGSIQWRCRKFRGSNQRFIYANGRGNTLSCTGTIARFIRPSCPSLCNFRGSKLNFEGCGADSSRLPDNRRSMCNRCSKWWNGNTGNSFWHTRCSNVARNGRNEYHDLSQRSGCSWGTS